MRFNISTILAKHWAFITILTGAALLRLVNLQSHIIFLGDQGRDVRIMRDLLLLRNIPFIGPPTSIGQVYSGPFFYYLMAPFLALSNFQPAGLAYATVFLSLVGLTLIYVIILRTVNKPVALATILLLDASWINIQSSRFAWNPNLMPFFSFALISISIALQKKPTIKNGLLFGAVAGLSLQLHYLVGLVIIGLLAIHLVQLVRAPEKLPIIQTLLSALAAGIATLSPLLLFELKHAFMNTRSLVALFQTMTHGDSSASYLAHFAQTVTQGLYHLTQFPLSATLSISLFLIIIVLAEIKAKRTKSPILTTHIWVIVLFFIGFSAIDSPRFAHYYGAILPSITLVLASLLFGSNKQCTFCKAPALLLCALLLGTNLFAARSVFTVGDNQIQQAYNMATAIGAHLTTGPYQITTIPTTETDDHYRYFLEQRYPQFTLLDKNSTDQPKELYVLCFAKLCNVLDDNQWAIASFQDKTIGSVFIAGRATAYQLLHGRDTIKQP